MATTATGDVSVWADKTHVILEIQPDDINESMTVRLTPEMARDLAFMLTKGSIVVETSAQK